MGPLLTLASLRALLFKTLALMAQNPRNLQFQKHFDQRAFCSAVEGKYPGIWFRASIRPK